jgi:hypothetical protein
LSQTPETIYRYRAFSSSTINLLCRDEQFFANPTDFNDPFDCSPIIEIDTDVHRLRAILKELVSTRVHADTLAALENAKFSKVMAASHAEQVAQREALRAVEYVSYHATNPEYDDPAAAEIGMLGYDIQTELRNRYGKGICCFSEQYDNPLLWSHYGDQHRGLCIGYSLDRRPLPDLKKVSYGGDRTITTSLLEQALLEKRSDAIELLDANVLLRKAPEWGYENEWRLIGKVGLQESPLKLTEITFGLRCSASVQHTVMKALHGRTDPVAFYEMRNIHSTFLLERSFVDMEEVAFLPNTAQSALEVFGDPEIN